MIESGSTSGTWSFQGTTSRWFFLQGKRTCRVVTWKVKYSVLPDSPYVDASFVNIEVDCQINTKYHLSEKFVGSRQVLEVKDVNLSRIAERMIREMASQCVYGSRAKRVYRQDMSPKLSVAELLASQG